MTIKIDVDLRINDASASAKLDTVIELLNNLTEKVDNMAGELDALTAQVSKNSDVIDSALTLIQGFKAQLDAAIASGNPAALTALSASIGASDDKLAAAVAANTPAAP